MAVFDNEIERWANPSCASKTVHNITIKENAKLLQCDYTEKEIVDIMKVGIAPNVRARLVFCDNPKNFEDLDQLCIHEQNVYYEENKVRETKHNLKTDDSWNLNKPKRADDSRYINKGFET
ncbi:hypothetical protein J6590_090191 [Homalodisca vitripennis]|nr:hypothetical protein J6590_090191 [Homalodisca vitripennis]